MTTGGKTVDLPPIPTAVEVLAEAIERALDDSWDVVGGGPNDLHNRILAALPKQWRLVPICGDCDGNLDQAGGHACPGQ